MTKGTDGTHSSDDMAELDELLTLLGRHGVLEFEGGGYKLTMVGRAPLPDVTDRETLAEEREVREELRALRKKRGLSPDEDPLLDG